MRCLRLPGSADSLVLLPSALMAAGNVAAEVVELPGHHTALVTRLAGFRAPMVRLRAERNALSIVKTGERARGASAHELSARRASGRRRHESDDTDRPLFLVAVSDSGSVAVRRAPGGSPQRASESSTDSGARRASPKPRCARP